MSNGHTPGPWKIRRASNLQIPLRNSVFCLEDEADELNIGLVSTWADDKEDAVEAEANARLIAAAPDLLEALEDIANDYAERFDMDSQSTNPGMKVVVENARAAIAKAKGQ